MNKKVFNKLRIAHVTPRFYPHIGGVETVVRNMGEEMAKRGHIVEILTTDSDTPKQQIESSNGIIVRRFKTSGPYYYSRHLIAYLKQNIQLFDVIHAHNLHTFIPFIATSVAKKNVSKIVISSYYHGRGKSTLSNILLWCYKELMKNYLKSAASIICISKYEAKVLSNHFKIPHNKITIIPVGVNQNSIKQAKTMALDGINLLVVSRLEQYKNIQLIIGAMKHLPDEYRLVIIGDGVYRKNLEIIASKMNLKARVSFLGQLEDSLVHTWYKSCNLLLNLSSLESFGINVIEGLSAEKPVLVNSSTALEELALRFEGVSGITPCHINPSSLSEAIQKSINIDSRSDLSDYSWAVITEQMIQHYINIINLNKHQLEGANSGN